MMTQQHNMTDYEKEYAEFKLKSPEYFNFAVDVMDRWAEDPEKLAMIWADDKGLEIRKTFLDIRVLEGEGAHRVHVSQ